MPTMWNQHSELLTRFARIAFFAGINLVLLLVFFRQTNFPAPRFLEGFAGLIRFELPEGASPATTFTRFQQPNLSTEGVFAQINSYRSSKNVVELELSAQLSTVAAQLLDAYAEENFAVESVSLDDELAQYLGEVEYRYELISHQALVGPYTNEAVLATWQSSLQQEQTILNTAFSEVGYATRVIDTPAGPSGVTIQLLANPQQAVSAPAPVQKNSTNLSFPIIANEDVVAALNAYRQVHGAPALQENEHLCTYAEKRVKDLQAFGGLDSHAGFRADFADPSQMPVGIREYPGGSIGENLAHQYCKNMTTGDSFIAQTGTALIEWCFDSSTKGHREAQLNPQFRNVCVRQADKMYVIIFGE